MMRCEKKEKTSPVSEQYKKALEKRDKKIAWDMAQAIMIMDVIKHKATHERRFRENNYKQCDINRRDAKLTPSTAEKYCDFIFQKLFDNVDKVDKSSLFYRGENERTKHPASRKYVAKLCKKYFGEKVSDNVMDKKKYNDNCFWFIKKMYGEEMKKLELRDIYGRIELYPQEFMYFMCRKMIKKLEKLGMKELKKLFRERILLKCNDLDPNQRLENFSYSLENDKQFPTSAPKDITNNNDVLKKEYQKLKEYPVRSNDSSGDSEDSEDKNKEGEIINNNKKKEVEIINKNKKKENKKKEVKIININVNNKHINKNFNKRNQNDIKDIVNKTEGINKMIKIKKIPYKKKKVNKITNNNKITNKKNYHKNFEHDDNRNSIMNSRNMSLQSFRNIGVSISSNSRKSDIESD